MSKFWQGFLCGTVVLTSIVIIGQLVISPFQTRDKDSITSNDQPLTSNSAEKSISVVSVEESEHLMSCFTSSNLDCSDSKNNDADIAEQKLSVDIDDKLAINSELEINRIIAKLNTLNDKELAKLEQIIQQLDTKLPLELFDNEVVDHDWALTKQIEIEYDFYDKSVLKDIGDLESVTCKSQHCLVKVNVPISVDLNPSHYYGWTAPVMVKINNAQANDFKTIELYIKRKD